MPSLQQQLDAFSRQVKIATKDAGVVRYEPFGTQRYLRSQLLEGIREGIHDYIVLKPRQVGASTEMLVFDAFWANKHKGLQGAVITDSDENKEFFRDVFAELIRGLPAKWSYPIRVNNRTMIAWTNGSRFAYQVAGVKETSPRGSRLGRSRGLAFVHATEVAYWGDEEGIKALRGALSERNPIACYVWESTANGFNFFYDMWQDAQHAATSRAIFIPWWRHELYELHDGDKAYPVYTYQGLNADERAWDREIQRTWGVTLTPGQWAWYRWKLAERMGSDIQMMHQEFPTLPQHAFQASGLGFLGSAPQGRIRQEVDKAPPPQGYRYTFGRQIEDSAVHPVDPLSASLLVWEEPQEHAHYVISADPAFGASEDSDAAVCQVWRALPQELIQVAEFHSHDTGVRDFAWVCMHLAGAFQTAYFILEVNGPGMSVWQEIERLQSWGWGTGQVARLQSMLGSIQHYLYKRPDTLGRGANWHWKTTDVNKAWIFSRLKDHLTQGSVIPRSKALVDEIGSVRQDGNKFEAHGRAHDDRVVAAALAVEMWQQAAVPVVRLLPPPVEQGPPPEAPPAHQRVVQDFFTRIVS